MGFAMNALTIYRTKKKIEIEKTKDYMSKILKKTEKNFVTKLAKIKLSF
jgi:hypothetical protein